MLPVKLAARIGATEAGAHAGHPERDIEHAGARFGPRHGHRDHYQDGREQRGTARNPLCRRKNAIVL